MKRILLVCIIMFAAFGMMSAEVRVEGRARFDNVYFIDTNSTFLVDQGGAFFVSRLEMGLRGDIAKDWFGNKITGRLTADLARPSTPIRHAFFDWAFLGGAFVFSAGLMPLDFGFVKFWRTPIPLDNVPRITHILSHRGTGVTNAATNASASPSIDFGFGFSGSLLPIEGLTKNLIFYNIQIVNGEGLDRLYSASTVRNDALATHLSLILTPITGLSLGGTYRINSYDYNAVSSYINYLMAKSESYAVFLNAYNVTIGEDFKIPIDFLVEYVSLNTTFQGKAATTYSQATNLAETNVTLQGYAFSIMLGYTFFDFLTPYVRFDMVDPNTSEASTNDMNRIIYFGANISADPKANLVFKSLFGYYLLNKDKETQDWEIRLQAEYRLSFSIWQ